LDDSGSLDKAAAKRKESREALVQSDFNQYNGNFSTDTANSIFSLMKSSFVSANKNATLSGDRTQAEVNAAIKSFKVYIDHGEDLTDNITNFHWFRKQDKAAAGKGRVGDTLATRAVQANFIATWGGVTINVHVDING